MPGYPYRMRDLVALSGISAPTIHFYAQQGLLPEPHKTSGNQARYPESTVTRLGWIRGLQTELRLTLRGIGSILERWGELPVEDMRALQALGTLLEEPDPAAPSEALAAVRKRIGPDDLDALVSLGLVRAGGGPLSSSDLRLLELVAAMRGAGCTGGAETVFNWEYDEGRDKLLNLYEKGKNKQWNSRERIDWSTEVDKDNPIGGPEVYVPIYGSPTWEKMGERDRAQLMHHTSAWQFSQFLHGEQGALICAAKIVQTVPDIDSKFYAATQVVDEARHVETYSRFLHEKLELAYPINANLKALLNDVVSDARWDLTYPGMQVLIEGLALAAFGLIRDLAENPLARAVNAYVMEDESRHVAFGRLALRDVIPQLSAQEIADREEFCVEACYLMRDRFLAEEVWETLGLPVDECLKFVRNSEAMIQFRSLLFTRIVPTLKDIGLFGDKIRNAFADMGVIGYTAVDLDSVMADDERAASEIDAGRVRQVEETIAAGAA